MKAHHRAHRETGGVNDAEKDLEDHPEARTDAKKIDHEAEERKHGGEVEKKRRKRKHGGEVHHSACKCHKCMGGAAKAHGGEVKKHAKHHGEIHSRIEHAKHVKVEGEHARHHAGHKPRKSGGRATSDENPFTSARKGEPAPGRKMMDME